MAAQGLEAIDAEAPASTTQKRSGAGASGSRPGRAARAEVGEERYRVWRIYLAGSAHAFDRGWLSLWQVLAGKPLPDGRLPHPLTRDYMYPPTGR
jgi:cyclopropane-fatty-acyl-phospholipid synthase